MINDDLSGSLGGDPNSPPPLSMLQGVVQSWDPDTGDNSILVGGGELANVPVLVAETAVLAVGDVVTLLGSGSHWCVLGKVLTPGDPGTVPTWNPDLSQLSSLKDIAAVTTGTTIVGATNVTSDPGTGAYAVINDPAYPGEVVIYSGNSAETVPARILSDVPSGLEARWVARSPELDSGPGAALSLQTDSAAMGGVNHAQVDADEILLNTFGTGALVRVTEASGLEVRADRNVVRKAETWHALTLAGSWVQDTTNPPGAGGDAAPSYHKDANGNVHVRGYIRAGAAVTIATLPVGYRPTLTYESPLLRANTGGANFSTVRVQTNGVIDVFTNSASAFVRLSLNFMFPTL